MHVDRHLISKIAEIMQSSTLYYEFVTDWNRRENNHEFTEVNC